MTATPNFASDARSGAAAGDTGAAATAAGPFVLNLCSSTTPMALAQTDLPELKRFNFFVSRRFEEGRERFRLHMGYFATLAEAEEWLNVVREIYPGAWAGEAPGKKLRERATAAAAAQAQHAAGPPPPVAAPRASAPVARQALSPEESLSVRVPTLQAAPEVARPAAPARKAAPPAPFPPPQPSARAPTPARPAAPAAPVAPPRKPAPAPPPLAKAPAAGRGPVSAAPQAKPVPPAPVKPPAARPAPPVPAPAARAAAAAPVKGEPAGKPAITDSNVREVLKALGDASATGETRLMRAPPPPREPAPPAPKSALSDTQVLKMLEKRRPEGSEEPAQDPAHDAVPMLKPDDTGTREALKEAVTSNAPVLFAVQLQWSVQPVELAKVPPLAIFSAYTLYTVEGSRDGRKWFGLRLGFFSDAISAKQVAHYVRSEFTSVAVVPVSPQEKARATDQDKKAATLGGPVNPRSGPVDEFKLIDDEPAEKAPPVAAKPAEKKIPGRPIPKVAVGRQVRPGASSAPPAKVRGRGDGKDAAKDRRAVPSLEETLEILGASELTIDNGNGETLNESGVRHLRVEVQKNSPFAKLLERLSERVKKS